jgi:hypothetical protein
MTAKNTATAALVPLRQWLMQWRTAMSQRLEATGTVDPTGRSPGLRSSTSLRLLDGDSVVGRGSSHSDQRLEYRSLRHILLKDGFSLPRNTFA